MYGCCQRVGVCGHRVADIPFSLVSFLTAPLATISWIWGVQTAYHSGSLLSCLSVLRKVASTPLQLSGKKVGSLIQGYFESQCGALLWASALTYARPCLIISSSFSSFSIISFPPGSQLPQWHPPHFGSQAAPILSHFHHSRNSLPETALLARLSPVSISSYLAAAVLTEQAKWVSDRHAVTSTSSIGSG